VQASEPGVPLYLPASHNVHEPWGPVYPAPHSVPGGGGGGDDDVPSSPLSPPPSPPPVPSPSVPVPGGGGGVDDDAPSSPLSPPPDGGGGMHEVSVTELGIGVGVGGVGLSCPSYMYLCSIHVSHTIKLTIAPKNSALVETTSIPFVRSMAVVIHDTLPTNSSTVRVGV